MPETNLIDHIITKYPHDLQTALIVALTTPHSLGTTLSLFNPSSHLTSPSLFTRTNLNSKSTPDCSITVRYHSGVTPEYAFAFSFSPWFRTSHSPSSGIEPTRRISSPNTVDARTLNRTATVRGGVRHVGRGHVTFVTGTYGPFAEDGVQVRGSGGGIVEEGERGGEVVVGFNTRARSLALWAVRRAA